jgi:hypothetical protein
MSWIATKESYRVASEAVGLPELGRHVLGVNVRRMPFPSDELRDAWKRVIAVVGATRTFEILQGLGIEMPRLMGAFRAPTSPTAEEALALLPSGAAQPVEVLAELKQMGLTQRYAVSPMVEMYRVDLATKPKNQHATEDGFACDLMALTDEWATTPTHYCEFSHVEPFA